VSRSGRPAAFDLRTARGLAEVEAAARLRAEGPNELPTDRRRGLLATAADVLREPMLLLLLAAGGLYLLLGDVREAFTLLFFVFVVIAITLFQERKTERALAALRDMSSPRALVIRDGRQRRIPGREVVRGDLVVVSEGDRVPADGVLLDCVHLEVDESLLTGESVPVRKIPWDGALGAARPGGDDLPFVYSGTLVVRGRGVAEVRAAGPGTEMGKIGKVLASVTSERTPLQREVSGIVRRIALLGVSLCVILVVVYGLTRGDWARGLLAGIALAMAVLPEEFPVVLTVFLALGAWRISKSRVLTRRVPAIETLGAATVLCADKTGTLTQNRMRVVRLLLPEAAASEALDVGDPALDALPEAFHEVVEFGILASQRDPFDPMEIAFHDLGQRTLRDTEHLHADWTLVREYPLSPALLSVSHVWVAPEGRRRVIAAKGAPEAIADLCHLDDARAAALRAQVVALASEGLRVLAVARAYFEADGGELPAGQHDFDFELVGLVGLADPVRPAVPAAVEECRGAGIRIVMITGDYPETARSVAQAIGLDAAAGVITGAELDAMSDEALRERLRSAAIVARAVPEQKLRIVSALRANGEVVAMTGDGVNDAPALKAAHIGVAMGGRGTDVAREAAALVVTDDDFSAIVAAVRLGRRIYDNLRKAMAYILAVHVPIAGMSLLPVLFGWPLVLHPVHIVFLELIIDPACSVAFEAEPEEEDVMRRPPRRPDDRLLTPRVIVVSVLQGASVLAATLSLFWYVAARGGSEAEARAVAFASLIMGNAVLILVNRSWSRTIAGTLGARNAPAWAVVSGALGFLLLALWVPWLRRLFRFAPISAGDLALAFGAGAASLAWFEALKALRPAALGGKGERNSQGGGETGR
jgi:Ca2+-transporting ATPase